MKPFEPTSNAHELYAFDNRLCIILWMQHVSQDHYLSHFKLLEIRYDRVILSGRIHNKYGSVRYDDLRNLDQTMQGISAAWSDTTWQNSEHARHFDRNQIHGFKTSMGHYNRGLPSQTEMRGSSKALAIIYGNRETVLDFDQLFEVTPASKGLVPDTSYQQSWWERLTGAERPQKEIHWPEKRFQKWAIEGIYKREGEERFSNFGDIESLILTINQAMIRPMLNPDTGEWIQFA